MCAAFPEAGPTVAAGVVLFRGDEAEVADAATEGEFEASPFAAPVFRFGSQIATTTIFATKSAPRKMATRAIARFDMAQLQRN